MENLHTDDENAIMELVSATHNPDRTDHFDANVVLSVVENILNFEKATNQEAMEEKLKELEVNYMEFPLKIRQLCFEIASKWLSTVNGHLTTICLLNTLSTYPWKAKMVLMLAAFSFSYGKLNIFSRLRYRKELTNKLALIMQITNPIATSIEQNPFDDSIKCALELTKCIIVELKESSSYSLPQSVISALPMASYWIGRSVASTTAYCARLPTSSVNDPNIITTKLRDALATCFRALEAKKAEESYKALQHALLFNNSSDKLEVLKLILNVTDNYERSLSTFYGSRKAGLNFYSMNDKVLLLLTSGLNISNERIRFLNSFYGKSAPYILWIPLVNDHVVWTSKQIEQKGDKMNFQRVDDPHNRVAQSFTRFVNENLISVFKTGDEPILVSLDQQGRIIHTNAMHMILTWASSDIEGRKMGVEKRDNIIPFIKKEMQERCEGLDSLINDIDKQISGLAQEVDNKINAWVNHINDELGNLIQHSNMYSSERETSLWQKEKHWSLGLVVGEIVSTIKYWISQESYIFLYGGNDIKWVREFTSKVHEVRSKTQSNIQMCYIGKNETIRTIITKTELSHLLKSSYHVWWFWTRLQSALLSRINYLNANSCHGDECDDEIANGFKKLLAYECNGTTIGGWALLSKGQNVILCGRGAEMLRVVNEFKDWTENMSVESLSQKSFKDNNKKLTTSCSLDSHPYCALEYPTVMEKTLKNEKCPECPRRMQKFVTFTCYHGDS